MQGRDQSGRGLKNSGGCEFLPLETRICSRVTISLVRVVEPYFGSFRPFHTKVINANVRDATHVLDGLLYDESDLLTDWHDTQRRASLPKPPHYLLLSQIDCSCQICSEMSLAIPPFENRASPSLLGFGKI